MLTSFHTESDGGESSTTRPAARCPSPRPCARGGWNPLLEVREVTPTDFLKGVFTDCVWVRSLTPLGRRPVGAPGRAHLPVRRRHRVRPAGRGRWSGRGGPSIDHSDVVPGEHPRRRLGARRPAARQGAQRRGAATTARCADRDGALGATLYQEHLLLPGSMADGASEPGGGRSVRRGRGAQPAGAPEGREAQAQPEGGRPELRLRGAATRPGHRARMGTVPLGTQNLMATTATGPLNRPGLLSGMPIAITEDHRTLGQTASDFLAKHDSRGAARALLEADNETLPAFWGDLADARLARPAPPRGRRRLGLRAARARRGRRGARPGADPGALRADGDRQRGHRRGGLGRPERRGCCRAWPTARSAAASRSRPTSRCRAARPPGRRRRSWAVASPSARAARRATTPSWSTLGRRASRWRCRRTSTRRGASARVTLDGAPVEVIAGRARGAGRPRRLLSSPPRPPASPPSAPSRRRPTPRCGCSSGGPSPPSRPSSTTAPTCSWPRSWPPPPCGTRPGRPTRAATSSRYAAADGGHAGAGRGRRVRQAQHPGARRDRVHLGARRPPVPAAGHRARGGRRTREAAARDVTDLVRRGTRRARTIDLPPEAEPMRDEVRAFAARVQGLDAAATARRR